MFYFLKKGIFCYSSRRNPNCDTNHCWLLL